jgi:hypothetical protein
LGLLLLLRRALRHGHDWRDHCFAEAAKAGVSVSRLERKSETNVAHTFEVRPRKDHRGVDLISDMLPFGRLWYAGPNAINNAMGYAKRRSSSNRALINVYDQGGNGSAFTHVVLCPAEPAAGAPKVHMGKVSPTFIDTTLCTCVWQ